MPVSWSISLSRTATLKRTLADLWRCALLGLGMGSPTRLAEAQAGNRPDACSGIILSTSPSPHATIPGSAPRRAFQKIRSLESLVGRSDFHRFCQGLWEWEGGVENMNSSTLDRPDIVSILRSVYGSMRFRLRLMNHEREDDSSNDVGVRKFQRKFQSANCASVYSVTM